MDCPFFAFQIFCFHTDKKSASPDHAPAKAISNDLDSEWFWSLNPKLDLQALCFAGSLLKRTCQSFAPMASAMIFEIMGRDLKVPKAKCNTPPGLFFMNDRP
jgi:hypothetical protein